MTDEKGGPIKTVIGFMLIVVSIIAVAVLIFGSWYNVDEGEVGVKFVKFGESKGFDPTEIAQGYGFKVPFRDRVITMSFRTQEIGFYGGTTERGQFGVITPKDANGINFNVDMTFRYRIDPTQASEFIEQKGAGEAAMQQVIATAARADSTRGVFGKYAQEDVPGNRIEIAQQILEVLQQRLDSEATGKLKPRFIVVEAVDLRNVQFDARIEEAIITKQTQKQEAEKQEYNLQIAERQKDIVIVNANARKQEQILIAEGAAEAKLAVATATAEGIEKVNKAYQGMPQEYVAVKFAEAIKPTDKIYLGFESLGGNSLNLLDINQATGLIHNKQQQIVAP